MNKLALFAIAAAALTSVATTSASAAMLCDNNGQNCQQVPDQQPAPSAGQQIVAGVAGGLIGGVVGGLMAPRPSYYGGYGYGAPAAYAPTYAAPPQVIVVQRPRYHHRRPLMIFR